jgi:hypothetical protein
MEKEIIIIKPKTLSPKDKEKLTKSGKVVVEHPFPEEVVFKKSIPETVEYIYTNCYRCGERIYLLKERLDALKESKSGFYCSHGHCQSYTEIITK